MEPNAESLSAEQRKLSTIGVLIIAAVALGVAITLMRGVLLPFVLALFLTYVVTPAIDFMEMRLRWKRWVALVLTLIVASTVMLGVIFMIVRSVQDVQDNVHVYAERLDVFQTQVIGWLQGLGMEIDSGDIGQALKDLPNSAVVRDAVGSIAEAGSNGVLTLIFFIFLVAGRSPWDSKGGVWEDIDRSVNRYLRTKLVTSLAIGAVFGGTFLAFGIDLALLFGILGFLLNFIPTIGSVLAILLAVPLVFVSVSPVIGAAVVGILVLAQNIIGNGIEPKMMGAGLDLHPATVLIGLGIWGFIWGPVGMLLSAPLMAIIRVVLRQSETTRPFSEVLAGRVGNQAIKGSVEL
ncbi:MAG: AI-2 transport protein TqsA [Myxococcota bacterium]|jgi:AI-2 transport protein TqsA